MLSESIGSGAGAAFENQHALKMAADADDAIAEAEGGEVRFCYVTPKIIITCDSAAEADEGARLIFKVCQNMGFDPRVETANANEAWLGAIPIHGWYDARKPLVSTRNLVDIMPLTSIWSGLAVNPCPYYPQYTGALLRCDHRQHAVPYQPPCGRYRTLASRRSDGLGQERGHRRHHRECPRGSADADFPVR